jgi:hypothetical protein
MKGMAERNASVAKDLSVELLFHLCHAVYAVFKGECMELRVSAA